MTPIYRIEGVEQQYGQRVVLRVPQLGIHDGEIFGLVGPSGAGKSTLLRLLAMLEAPARGSVTLRVHEQDYHHTTIPISVKRQIAMVFQRPALMSRTVRTNVAYGLKLRGAQDVNLLVDEVLERVSLSHLANARPRTLSGGEMQRVSIARALVLQPRVLILDEPTANLDPYNVRLIERLLHDQHERFGTTIVIVTHNIFQARRLAQRVGLIYDSALIEVAETETFFESPQDARTEAFISGDLVW